MCFEGGGGGERESRIWWVCCAIGCSNKVYQCWNHKPQGQLFTASLNTQCHLVSLESHWRCLCLSFSPSATLILLFWLSPPLCLPNSRSFFFSCLFSFSFPLAVSASISRIPFVLDSFASSMSLLFMFISLFVSLSCHSSLLNLCVQT